MAASCSAARRASARRASALAMAAARSGISVSPGGAPVAGLRRPFQARIIPPVEVDTHLVHPPRRRSARIGTPGDGVASRAQNPHSAFSRGISRDSPAPPSCGSGDRDTDGPRPGWQQRSTSIRRRSCDPGGHGDFPVLQADGVGRARPWFRPPSAPPPGRRGGTGNSWPVHGPAARATVSPVRRRSNSGPRIRG
jgi:hypothetical protein